ncbi:MAG: penicillin-binding protein activator, partial [Deltaproteobacteria bacterium]|nr:penicillin-binding protein activator [Deltaproteobacteria bacterium]
MINTEQNRNVFLCTRLRALAVFGLLAWSLSCASGGQTLNAQDSRRAQLDYEAASALFAQDPEAGVAALTEFVGIWPTSKVADDAALEIAQHALAKRDGDRARHYLLWIVNDRPRSNHLQTAQLLLAQIEMEQGNFETGYQRASGLKFEQLSPEEQNQAFALLTDFDAWREDAAAELFWRAKWHALSQDPQTRLEQEEAIRALLKGPLANYDFQLLAEHLQDFALADHLALFAAERAMSQGDLERAERSLKWLERRELSPELMGLQAALQQEVSSFLDEGVARELPAPLSTLEGQPLPDLAGVSGTLGVVLPLSGKWKRFGEESLKGILIATDMFNGSGHEGAEADDEFRPALRLVVRDSAGSAVQAAAAVRELSEIQDVVAVIGPLHHEAAEAAAEVAERLEIPLLTLTSREDVSRDRPHVFRFGMTQDSRTEALAELVKGELGLGRVAILYPGDQYGKRLKNLFWDSIEAHGGEVVGIASYAPDATDFAKEIRSLVGYTLLTYEEKALLEERKRLRYRSKRLPLEEAVALRSSLDVLTTMDGEPLPPIVDFDALFIADSHE